MAGETQKNATSLSPFDQGGLPASLPDKRYFKIGEVCKIVGVKQHVVRYWETEFKQFIKPQRASSRQRLYRRADIENLLIIKQLLKGDGFTIPGARKYLATHQLSTKTNATIDRDMKKSANSAQLVSELKGDLQSLLQMLEEKKK